MFDRRAFSDAPRIVLGAIVFGGTFALLSLLADLVTEGGERRETRALLFGALAFVGYLAIATYLHGHPDEEV